MKIFLPFKTQDIGGTSTFARKFTTAMKALGHDVVSEHTPDYDVLFLIVQAPLRYVVDAKKRGKKIVQRLDGTYYWSVAGWKFPLLNAKAAYIRHAFTDFTVYQSRYSQECANRFLGRKRHDRHAIIYNGVDETQFSPDGPTIALRDNPKQHLFFTASAFRRFDQITPILRTLEAYRDQYGKNFKLLIAGTFTGAVSRLPAHLKKITYIKLLGKLSHTELPKYARSSDVFLFTHLNPPCPNNIIEALACGLPICGLTDGAMPELVSDGKNGRLLSVAGTGFWRMRRFDAAQFAATLNDVVCHQADYRRSSRRAAEERFTLTEMANQYNTVLERLLA